MRCGAVRCGTVTVEASAFASRSATGLSKVPKRLRLAQQRRAAARPTEAASHAWSHPVTLQARWCKPPAQLDRSQALARHSQSPPRSRPHPRRAYLPDSQLAGMTDILPFQLAWGGQISRLGKRRPGVSAHEARRLHSVKLVWKSPYRMKFNIRNASI